jgi:hypothetical protein
MPSPDITARLALCTGLLSPIVAMMIPNSRWLFPVFLVATALVGVAIWIIGEAVDVEAAKPKENLDVLLGYAINFWTVIFGGSFFIASFAVKAAWFHFRKRKPARPKLS